MSSPTHALIHNPHISLFYPRFYPYQYHMPTLMSISISASVSIHIPPVPIPLAPIPIVAIPIIPTPITPTPAPALPATPSPFPLSITISIDIFVSFCHLVSYVCSLLNFQTNRIKKKTYRRMGVRSSTGVISFWTFELHDPAKTRIRCTLFLLLPYPPLAAMHGWCLSMDRNIIMIVNRT